MPKNAFNTIIEQVLGPSKQGQLNDQQLRTFFNEGFLVIEDFFDIGKELDPARDSLAEKVNEVVDLLYENGKISDKLEHLPFSKRMIEIEQQYPGATVILHKKDQMPKGVRELFCNERLLNVLEQIIGPDLAGHPVWNIRPKIPQEENYNVPWHQDSAYSAASFDDVMIVTAWIPFLDTNAQNGCLQFIKGGHAPGKLGNHKGCFRDTWYLYMEDKDIKDLGFDPEKDVVTCPVKQGSLVIFSNMLPHRSLPNRSDEIRWSIDLRWHSAKYSSGDKGKESIVLRKSDDPGYSVDMNTWAKKSRREIYEQNVIKELDTIMSVERFLKRWPIVHENRHTQAMEREIAAREGTV